MPAKQNGAGVATAWRFARRELRGGLRGFAIFLACIGLGVAAIAGVGSVARGMTEGIAREGRSILGGDLQVSLLQRRADPAERAWLAARGTVSEVATLRAMARRNDGEAQTLVELKAVDDLYPLFGALAVAGEPDPRPLLAATDGGYGALADAELLTRLDLAVGDLIAVGSADLVIRGVITEEPDLLSGGFALGPRLLVSAEALTASGLVQPGSLVEWHYRVRLAGTPGDAEVTRIAEAAEAAFPEAAWRVRTRGEAAPGLERNILRFAEFLTLIGLSALVVGGVGVANAVASYMEGKRDVIATLRALGAPAAFPVVLYLMVVMAMAGIGIGGGLLGGAAIPFVAGHALERVVPVTIAGLYPAELGLAALYGLLTALAFALYPLGRAGRIRPSALFRDEVAPVRTRPSPLFILAIAITALGLAGLAIGLAFDRRVAAIFVVAAAGAFVVLRLVATVLMQLARRVPRPRSVVFSLALGNLHRPGALTPSVVLSLGLGLTLLVALVLIDGNFRRELFGSIPATAPSFFFLDIQEADTDGLIEFVARAAPGADLDIRPMLRGRIVQLAGVPAEAAEVADDVRWVLRGDRGVTYADKPPDGADIVAGAWWPAGHDGPPQVSFDAEIAAGLGLEVGDTVTVNVLGREITAEVANLRTVEWQSLSINTVMIFSPDAFRGAPFTSLATLAYPEATSEADELAFLAAVVAAFPAVTVVRVKEAIETVNDIVGQIGWAVRGASAVTIVAAMLVLGGAFAAGRHRRIHDAVVLKTLGATRRRLIGALALEFLLLGAATAVFGLIAGSLAAWLVLRAVMDIPFAFLPGPALSAAAAALVLTLAFGLLGTWRVLGQKAAPALRNL